MNAAWIVVAESSQARIFSAHTPIAPLNELTAMSHPQSRAKVGELVSTGRGLTFQSAGEGRHTTEPSQDAKAHEAELFARQVVQYLETGRNEHRFDRLIVVAPPAFLGLMRSVYSDALAKLVTHEVPKNLAQLPTPEIRSHLPERI